MTSAWRNIDPNKAEAMLRGLNRRLADLEGSLAAQQICLRNEPDSFAFRLGCKSLMMLQERLAQERIELLRHRVAEKINIAIEGADFARNSANIGTLGTFLIRMQKLFNSVAQSITSGPKMRGPIPTDILKGTNLQLASTYPSSFGMSLFVDAGRDLIGESLASSSLKSLFELLDAVTRDDGISDASAQYGSRSLNHLRHMSAVLSRADAKMNLEWSDYSGIKHYWHVDAQQATEIEKRISSVKEINSEVIEISGMLVGASLLRNRFELVSDDQTLIQGVMGADVRAKIKDAFGLRCTGTFDMTEILDITRDNLQTYYILQDIVIEV